MTEFVIYKESGKSLKARYCVTVESFEKKKGVIEIARFKYEWDGLNSIGHILYSSKEKDFLQLTNKEFIHQYEDLKKRGFKTPTDKQLDKFLNKEDLTQDTKENNELLEE